MSPGSPTHRLWDHRKLPRPPRPSFLVWVMGDKDTRLLRLQGRTLRAPWRAAGYPFQNHGNHCGPGHLHVALAAQQRLPPHLQDPGERGPPHRGMGHATGRSERARGRATAPTANLLGLPGQLGRNSAPHSGCAWPKPGPHADQGCSGWSRTPCPDLGPRSGDRCLQSAPLQSFLAKEE